MAEKVAEKEQGAGQLSGVDWQLHRANRVDPELLSQSEKPLSLGFSEDGKSVRGFSGCNQFMASAELSGNRLVLGPIAGTRMACGEQADQLEIKFLSMLADVRQWRLVEGGLVLIGDNDVELSFINSTELVSLNFPERVEFHSQVLKQSIELINGRYRASHDVSPEKAA